MSTTNDNKKTMDFYDSMLNYFEDLNSLQAKVGVHASAGEENVKKAIWNEYGTNRAKDNTKLKYNSVAIMGEGLKPINSQNRESGLFVGKGSDISIPPRPFVRLFLYPDLVDKLAKDTMDYINVVLSKKKIRSNDARETYKRMGITGVDLMRSKMEYKNFDKSSNHTHKDQEHNSPITQYIKGKDTPLFDTGELYDAVDYKVRKRRT